MPHRPPRHAPPRPARRKVENRPSAHERGYTRAWNKYARGFLKMHPTCAGFPRGSCHAPAEHVDHVEPAQGPDDPDFWEPANHQPLCASCHSRKTSTEDGGFGRPRRG